VPFTKEGFFCDHCAAPLEIDSCINCGRLFVYTKASLEHRTREFDDPPLLGSDVDRTSGDCDHCIAEDIGASPAEMVEAGLRQNTCPVCHADTLS
jgi:hypothetical protein